jgi:hypothetical protein
LPANLVKLPCHPYIFKLPCHPCLFKLPCTPLHFSSHALLPRR